MHISSLHATATPNRDWNRSVIGWFGVTGTIPNNPNAVDLRVFFALGTVQTEETETFINSKGLIIALMKSKSLQLQSNKSRKKKEQQKHCRQKFVLFYVLYLFHGNAPAVVPLVAGWQETTQMYRLDFGAKKQKKKSQLVFFSPFFFKLYQSEYHCYSKIVSLVLFGGTRLATSAMSCACRWASQTGVEWGVGVSTECLFAVVLLVSGGSPTVQNLLLGSTWPSLRLATKTWPITALLDPAVDLPSPRPLPLLSSLTQRSL